MSLDKYFGKCQCFYMFDSKDKHYTNNIYKELIKKVENNQGEINTVFPFPTAGGHDAVHKLVARYARCSDIDKKLDDFMYIIRGQYCERYVFDKEINKKLENYVLNYLKDDTLFLFKIFKTRETLNVFLVELNVYLDKLKNLRMYNLKS